MTIKVVCFSPFSDAGGVEACLCQVLFCSCLLCATPPYLVTLLLSFSVRFSELGFGQFLSLFFGVGAVYDFRDPFCIRTLTSIPRTELFSRKSQRSSSNTVAFRRLRFWKIALCVLAFDSDGRVSPTIFYLKADHIGGAIHGPLRINQPDLEDFPQIPTHSWARREWLDCFALSQPSRSFSPPR